MGKLSLYRSPSLYIELKHPYSKPCQLLMLTRRAASSRCLPKATAKPTFEASPTDFSGSKACVSESWRRNPF